MKKLLILPLLCAIILNACQQKADKKTTQKETPKEIATEASAEEVVREFVEEKAPFEKANDKTILDTITATSNDGEPLKIFVYKYIYPNNKKYLRDFDIINSKDSIILSAMQEEYHWRGLVNDSDEGEVNLVPTYNILNAESLSLMFGFYINPYDLASELENYTHSSVKYYLSRTLSEYPFKDSVMSFMNLNFHSKQTSIEFTVKINTSELIPTDSIYTILNNKKENTSWGMTAIIDGSFMNLILGNMSYDQIKSIPLLIEYFQDDDGRSIRQFMMQSYIFHSNTNEYKTFYQF